MKKSTAPAGIALALLVLWATAAFAAPVPPTSDPTAPTAAVTGSEAPLLAAIFGENTTPARAVWTTSASTCGPRMYRCELCQDGFKLCFTQICGNFVIVNCDPCHPECILPPS